MRVPFTKMHGIGNDFILIDELDLAAGERSLPITAAFAEHACSRRFGVGADQILWLKRPQQGGQAHARMEILNADGSVAEMCGNGVRSVGIYLDRRNAERAKSDLPPGPRSSEYRIETLAGLKTVRVEGDLVTVDMGQPILGGGFPGVGESLLVKARELRFFEVSMGNPHAVVFVDNAAACPVEELGPQIETHRRFPKRTNVEFVQVLEFDSKPKGRSVIQVRVWERGAGITLACGTGACAAAVAALATGRVSPGPVEVRLPGGNLRIQWAGTGQPVYMTGPAVEVFRGEIDWPEA